MLKIARDMLKFMKLEEIKKMLLEAGVEPRLEVLKILQGEDCYLKVSKKLPSRVGRIKQEKLKHIHDSTEVARELCLVILENFSSCHTRSIMMDDPAIKEGYKRLYSPILQTQVRYKSGKTSPYRAILDLLIEEQIIEPGAKYSTAKKTSNEYRLTENYRSKGVYSYKIKTAVVQKLRGRSFKDNLDRVLKTKIGRNSLMLRSIIDFPTIEEVTEHLKEASRTKYINKKGKKLVMRGKNHSRYPESEYVFIENYLQIYEYLRDCLKIPIVSPFLADERIIDCFNIMPSLIRQMLNINGKPIVESDFTCLHPNIAQMLYSDINRNQISHEKVAKCLLLEDVKTAKIEHLSYFNKEWSQLEHSVLHKYYMSNDPRMMEKICIDKALNGYKNTSRELFKVETNMMDEIVGILNSQGIIVMYVFDAIYSAEIHKEEVIRVMNQVAEKFNVRTSVKVKKVSLRKAA